ncbi:Protein of unknown function [Pyronema omphalodes CBS 100304]|uniref:Uncharacterized protein n=1 Tax=Pyronema omphalodes (strain CBS 100304) TaxID=1076935 RepID=U4LHL0_PYROM|nr:Protein of unknown function [Pyronema omphalodes CBS 100304]
MGLPLYVALSDITMRLLSRSLELVL